MSKYLRNSIIALLLLTLAALIITGMRALPLKLLDFENYLSATRMLQQRQNPYGVVEFFSLPWLALLLLPLTILPLDISASIWFLGNLICIEGSVLLALHWLGDRVSPPKLLFVAFTSTLMPGSIFAYITGQVTPLVAAALLSAAYSISSSTYLWLPAVSLLLSALKPNITALPVLICVLELIRRRRRGVPALTFVGLLVLCGLAQFWLPDWFPSLIEAWKTGSYRGGERGLLSPGYIGLGELGIPQWIFLPLAAYVVWRWYARGFNPEVFSLAICVNLLLVPYSRSYDFVVLILPLTYLADVKNKWDYGLLAVSLLNILILPFTTFSAITPAILTLALLLKTRSLLDLEHKEEIRSDNRIESKERVANIS